MRARVTPRDHSGEVDRFLIGLQKSSGCLAVGCDGPGGEAFVGVEAQRAVFLLMDGGNIDEPEFLAHPDLIDLDVGVGRDGVLQVSDSGY